MSILVDRNAKLAIQGITGTRGRWMVNDLIEYGTAVVAGVVPGRSGQNVAGVPVFHSMERAVRETTVNTSLVLVPASSGGVEAVYEAAEAGISLVVWVADPVPLHDMVRLKHYLSETRTLLVGPNTPGVISPGLCKVGFMPSHCYRPGRIGVISRSGSLSYEVCLRLSQSGIGQSTVVGVGGDPIKGLRQVEALERFELDEATAGVLLLGEVGGVEEYEVIEYLKRNRRHKPVVAFLVGRTAPLHQKMGHAGAIVYGEREHFGAKRLAFQSIGIPVAQSLGEIPQVVTHEILNRTDSQESHELNKEGS